MRPLNVDLNRIVGGQTGTCKSFVGMTVIDRRAMFKIENMACLTARIGKHFLKLKKPDIRHHLRHVSYIKAFKDNFTKKGIVMTTVAAGCVATSVAGYVVYTRTQSCSDGYTSPKKTVEATNNKLQFTASPKGKIIGDVKIEVEPTGTTIECRTDLNGGTNHKHVFRRFKTDKYKFIQQNNHNPEVSYKEETNISTIVFHLSDINE